MKIVVFGASGKTGNQLINQALNKGYHVIAYVRSEISIKIDNPLLKVVVGKLNDVQKIQETLLGCDACISALGGTSMRKPELEFTNGIVNIVNAMQRQNVGRFIYLSSIGAGDSRYYMKQPIRFFIADLLLKAPLADHTQNEKVIQTSKLNWTIVRPGSLTNGGKVENINHGVDKINMKGNHKTSRASVASFMLNQLLDETYSKKAVWVFE